MVQILVFSAENVSHHHLLFFASVKLSLVFTLDSCGLHFIFFSICLPPFEAHNFVHLTVIPPSMFLLPDLLRHMSKLTVIESCFVQIQWYISHSSLVSYYCFVMFTFKSDCARIFFAQTFRSLTKYSWWDEEAVEASNISELVVASSFQFISWLDVYIHTYSSIVLWS